MIFCLKCVYKLKRAYLGDLHLFCCEQVHVKYYTNELETWELTLLRPRKA